MRHFTYQEAIKFPTPFFLFDVNHLAIQVAKIKNAFKMYWENGMIAYSVKTNSLPFLAEALLEMGVGAEVVSEDEFNLVSQLNFKGDSIVCNGPIKHKNWIENALEQGCYLNIDSKNELKLVKEYANNNPQKEIKIGLRVNNDIEDIFPNASTAGENGSRFGFSYETGELEAAISELRSVENIVISGLHLHISTNVRSLAIYKYIVCKFDEIVKRFKLSDIEYLDAGGGFYGEVPNKPTWDDYISALSAELKAKGYVSKNLKVIIEPGVSLLSGCFSYYTRVEDVKDTARSHFVVLDGSRNHIDPLMHKTIKSYFFSICQEQETPMFEKAQTLVGYTCLEYDTFFKLEGMGKLQRGDIIRFDKVGAYTMTFSPLFISWFPTVYYTYNGNVGIARGKWTTDEVLQKSRLKL